MKARTGLAVWTALAAACSGGLVRPVPIAWGQEACRSCRMILSDARFAAQIVAPGEEPLLFDDIGCLREFLESASTLPAGAMAYVSDHRTRAWVPAATASYVQTRLDTPMGSGLIAYGDVASRTADAAVQGRTVTAADVFRRIEVPSGRNE